MISVDGLTVEFGGTTLFSDISFQINEKDRIALMGKNFGGCPSAFPRKSDCPQGLCSRLSSTAFDDGGRSYGF